MGPLTGIRVLEIGDRGEVAGKLLADAGADVLKIEPGNGAASRRIGRSWMTSPATTAASSTPTGTRTSAA